MKAKLILITLFYWLYLLGLHRLMEIIALPQILHQETGMALVPGKLIAEELGALQLRLLLPLMGLLPSEAELP